MKVKKLLLGFLLAISVCGVASAATDGIYWKSVNRNLYQKGDWAWAPNMVVELEASSTALTSPSAVVSAVGVSAITLTADANLTTATVTGGVQNQVLYIFSGAGSNTVEFADSGTTMALGSNVTITEGQSDCLILRCTNAAGNNWQKIGGNDN